ncbi:MAG: peptidylprolyl isomerase, partial [Marmoricola sp.]
EASAEGAPSEPTDGAAGTCTYTADGSEPAKKVDPPQAEPAETGKVDVEVDTNVGAIKATLDAGTTPCTVNSFLSLAKQDYFDKTKCHRITTEGIFVLQCGDPTATGTGGPGYAFADELVPSDPRLQPCLGQTDPTTGAEVCTYTSGTLAMANSGPDTNGSQFFLVYQDSPLPAAYTAFGRMSAAGVKVVQGVAAKGIAADGIAPKQPVTITSVK